MVIAASAVTRSQRLLLNSYSPDIAGLADLDNGITLRLGGAWNISHTAWVIEHKFEPLTASHLFQPDFGMGPVERALNSAEVELGRVRAHGLNLA